MAKQSCRTCELYDLGHVKSKTGRVMSHSIALCKWEPTPMNLPSSIPSFERKSLRPMYMRPTDGSDCSCYTKRVKEPT